MSISQVVLDEASEVISGICVEFSEDSESGLRIRLRRSGDTNIALLVFESPHPNYAEAYRTKTIQTAERVKKCFHLQSKNVQCTLCTLL